MLGAVFLIFNFGGGEIFIILMVFILLFGAKRIPEVARALGKGMREIRNATNDIQREIKDATGDSTNLGRQVEERIRQQTRDIEGAISRTSPRAQKPASNSDEGDASQNDEASSRNDAPEPPESKS
ncbi:twin-arginine translocase TatA/TatE family subunit [Cryomorphaceae bacterium]|nr:twin-arginine translocase TatA/TatE family subunit [Cryomorphaceae bacterium]